MTSRLVKINGVAVDVLGGVVRSSLTQHGVTFTFNQPYTVGQFINGDWWVIPATPGGTVTVIDVTPAYDAGTLTNGWMINPTNSIATAYDGRVGPDGATAVDGWTPALLPALPLTMTAGKSVIKAISEAAIGGMTMPGHLPALKTAVVLTVLDAQPADDAFRPPYFGVDKPIFTYGQVVGGNLPALAPPTGVTQPTLDWIAARFARVQLDHHTTWRGRYMHPSENFRATPDSGDVSNYGGSMARDHNDAILRLMLNDATWAEKKPALIAVLQAAIDWYGAAKAGLKWHPDGGHMVGRKQMIVFAAVLFNDPDMKTVAGSTAWDSFSEVGHVYTGAERALYGRPEEYPGGYWQRIEQAVGKRDVRDPTSQIDGGDDPGHSYQDIVSGAYSEAALIGRLLPGGMTVWNHPAFFEYVDRWRTHGAWTLPDTESARRPAFAARHGFRAWETYRSKFAAAMWSTHRGVV